MQRSVTNFIDYSDLECFIAEAFNLEGGFEILESPNDVDYAHDVTGGEHPEYLERAERVILQGHAEYWWLHGILELLHSKGYIKKGRYVVQVSW